jgi:hypothetical protein
METLSILIGNSDDKLTQSAWSDYIQAIQMVVQDLGYTVHFHGFSHGDAPWQNACWVIEGDDGFASLFHHLELVAWAYGQESIAVVRGETQFVKPRDHRA